MTETQELHRLLFNTCKSHPSRVIFIEAWVRVEKIEEVFQITEVDAISYQLAHYDEDDAKTEIFEIDPKDWDVVLPGYYLMAGLFNIRWDSDDYRRWTYLEAEIVEFDFQVSIEEHDSYQQRFESINTESSDDLFNI